MSTGHQPLEPRLAADCIAFLAKTELFSELSALEVESLARYMEVRALAQGQFLIREGEPGDSLYLVFEGLLQVTQRNARREEVSLNLIGPGESVGEIALLTGERRSASVYARQDTVLFALPKPAFEHIRQTSPQVTARFSQIIGERIQKAELRNLLYVSELLKNMGEAALRDLEAELELILCRSGECLMREGDESDCSFIVVSGRLRVTDQHGEGGIRLICELGRGQTVGEMGILTGAKRAATVTAMRDTLVAKLSLAAFNRLLRNHPQDTVKHFAGEAVNRLWMQTLGKFRNQNDVANIAIVPTGHDVRMAPFTRLLAESLAAHGSTLYLDSGSLDDYLSPSGIAQTPINDPNNGNIARWLNHQESTHRFILYQTDPGPTEWTKRCLRQADRIVLVGEARASPKQCAIEETLLRDLRYQHLPKILVILHDSAPYNNTAAWLKERELRHHYHVCPSEGNDIARLGRLLIGKGVGLVLGGGGARGFAHIGALKALQEAGILIDKLGGTSIGSIIGAMAALRWDYATMLGRALSFNYRMDYTYPAVALTAGYNITHGLKKGFGDQKIEDLWINFFCVSTDLSTGRQWVHEQGLLWKYVRASMSIPGLFPPVIEGKSFFVDGGLVNNLPIDVLRAEEDIGYVFAFDVAGPAHLETEVPIEGSFSGWKAFIRKLNPFASSIVLPSLAKTLMLTSVTKSTGVNELMKNMADFYMRFPVQDYGLMDFNKLKKIAETGYAYACEQLRAWEKDGSLRKVKT
ncbi:MAG: cyclic nucleotide-binding and patatin-like phospholipase domain-containing protein [Gammaproteobacteria bacterium]